MSFPMSSDSMANLFRLSGLKNVNGRRRVAGEDDLLDDLELEDTDVSGTQEPLLPKNFLQNAPVNMEGSDVRANQVINPQEEKTIDSEFWRNFGRTLATQTGHNTPPAASPSQVSPPNPQGEIAKGLPSHLQDVSHLFPAGMIESMTPEQIQSLETAFSNNSARMQQRKESLMPGKNLSEEAPPIATQQTDLQEGTPPVNPEMEMSSAEEPISPKVEDPKEPGTYVKVGSAQLAYANPETRAEVERIFGAPLTKEKEAEIKDFEKAVDAYINKLNGVDTALSKRERQLLDKVENRDLTPGEQVSMVLALLAPSIVAGVIGGKEAFLGGLSGGSKNLSAMLGRQDKEIKDAEEEIPELALQRAKIAKEKVTGLKEGAELNQKMRSFLSNANIDPKLKDVFSRDGAILKGKLVLDTGNPLLPLKSSRLRSIEDVERFKEKEMPELEKAAVGVKDSLLLIDQMGDLLDAVEKSRKAGNEGLAREWIPFYDTVDRAYKSFIPAGRDSFKDEDGNIIKFSELYNSYREGLKDQYLRLFPGGTAQKSRQESFFRELPNPFTKGAFFGGQSSLAQTKKQIGILKNRLEEHVLNNLDQKGVDTGPMKELFSQSSTNRKSSEEKRRKERADQAVNQVLGGY